MLSMPTETKAKMSIILEDDGNERAIKKKAREIRMFILN